MPRAAVFHRAGVPCEVVSFARPEPCGSEVLVQVTCCTLCRSDLHTHAGRRVEPTPTILGHEIVGRVAAFGPDSPRIDAAGQPVEIGSRITWAVVVGCGGCFFCANELPQKCCQPYKYGHHRVELACPVGGGLADHVVLVPRTYWLRVPDEVPDFVAAMASCATATAAGVVRNGGPVEGRSVLIFGAGVLGLTACAMVRSAGAREVIVSDPVAACRERAQLFGATHVFPPESLQAGVFDVTSGRGADVVYELAGTATTVEAALAFARTGATVILAGTVVPVGTVSLDPERVVRQMVTIRGVHNYLPRDLSTALEFLAGPGQAYPWQSLISGAFPLDEIESAFAAAHKQPGVRIAVVP